MIKMGIIIMMLTASIGLQAQENRDAVLPADNQTGSDVISMRPMMPRTASTVSGASAGPRTTYVNMSEESATDSLHLPVMNTYNASPIYYPYSYWGGYGDWELHPGLNASIGMSASVGLGRGSLHGVGFGQNISVMYAQPLSCRVSLAVGGYYNRLDWDNLRYNNAGLTAILGYQFNDRLCGYIYGQKSLIGNRYMPPYLMDMDALGDRIGATLHYKFSPSFSVSLSVERRDNQ